MAEVAPQWSWASPARRCSPHSCPAPSAHPGITRIDKLLSGSPGAVHTHHLVQVSGCVVSGAGVAPFYSGPQCPVVPAGSQLVSDRMGG